MKRALRVVFWGVGSFAVSPNLCFLCRVGLYHTALILLLSSYAHWCILLMWGHRALTQVVGGPTRVISALPCLAGELDGQDFRLVSPKGGLYGKLSC